MDKEIQDAFLDGMNEVYATMFTDQLEFQALDMTNTHTNIYGESPAKVFLPTIKLVGNFLETVLDETQPVEENNVTTLIKIPTKQLIINNIGHLTEADFKNLERAQFTYRGRTFTVNRVVPTTLIADLWQVYEFHCSLVKKQS